MTTKSVPPQDLRFAAPANVGEQPQGENGLRQFEGIAYTGAPVQGFMDQLVVDLESLQVPDQLPALVGHDRKAVAGYANQISVTDNGLEVAGYLSQTTEEGREVAGTSDEGFPWQLSIDVSPGAIEEVQPGAQATVNGREVNGPAIVFRDSTVAEVSFTPTGKDSATTAKALSHEGVEIPIRGSDPMTTNNTAGSSQNQGQGQDQGQGQGMDTAQLQEKVRELEARLSAETQRADNAESKLNEKLQEERKGRVKAMLEGVGREYSDEAAQPYMQMSDEAFSAVEADFAKLSQGPAGQGGEAPQPQDKGALFEEQATGTDSQSAALEAPGEGQAEQGVVEQMAKL